MVGQNLKGGCVTRVDLIAVSWLSGERLWLDVVGNWESVGSSAREQCDEMVLS